MKNKKSAYSLLLMLSLFCGCIGDDFIQDLKEPEIRITTSIDTLEINSSIILESIYLDEIGQQAEIDVLWDSSNDEIASIEQNGLLSAHQFGTVTISASYQDLEVQVSDSITVVVGAETVITQNSINGIIETTSSYKLTGDFELAETDTGLRLSLAENYCASTALPGLYVYLSNNANSISNAYEIAAVQVFEGAHSYEIPEVGLSEYSFILYYCKPFNVKVGDGNL